MSRAFLKISEFLKYYSQLFESTCSYLVHRNETRQVTVVTAFDSSHFRSGIQLLNSLVGNVFVTDVFVFNLGLLEAEAKELKQLFPDINLLSFNFKNLPEFLQMGKNAGNYGWKPLIINEVAKNAKGILIWSDAGNVFQPDISAALGLVIRDKVFAGQSSGTIGEYTHSSLVSFFRLTSSEVGRPQVSAAYCYLLLRDPRVRSLIREWASLAQSQEMLAPIGSSRLNHRQDQTLLSLLLLRRFGKFGRRNLRRSRSVNLAGVLTHQDLET